MTDSATRIGSKVSSSFGFPVVTAQYLQALVQISPNIIKVAVPRSQHSPMLGQCASSHTVWRFFLRINSFNSMYLGPPGILALIQGGKRVSEVRFSGIGHLI